MTSVALGLLLFAQWLTFDGKGKHVVLVSGDDEYRSEQAMPELARILSKHHGFKTTVLFSLDPDGTVNPERKDNIPGLEALKTADLMILFTRFRDLPDAQMKHIVDYVEAGKPIVGIRTATHAFDVKAGGAYEKWGWKSKKDWDGGFGRQVLGETWVAHHGKHKIQSTRARFVPEQKKHPILKGIRDGEIWAPTDVYTVANPLPGDSVPLLLGEVLEGMNPSDKPVAGIQNEPKLPVAWTKTYKSGRVFTTTLGSSQDLQNEALRRLLVNATYWALGLEKKIPSKAKVDLTGPYNPTPFGFGAYLKGKRPEDY